MRGFIDTASTALLRKDKLRDETSVGQAALKVLPAQREVVELYYRRPSCFFLSEAGCGEIDLLEDGQELWAKVGDGLTG